MSATVQQVDALPAGYTAISGVQASGPGKAADQAATLKDEKRAVALLKQHFKQHAEPFPKDFDAHTLVFRVVTAVENAPQAGWGMLVVEFGYKPHGHKKK
ncbi:MAG TPA: hypothetical protein VHJ20_24510 [Polyangia bacterium]|nr:hypothetical protein [Polyangia bacterium]